MRTNRVCHLTIPNVGFMEDVSPRQLNKIQKHISDKYEQKTSLFDQEDDIAVKQYVDDFFLRILPSQKLDIKTPQKFLRMVDMDTLQHSNAQEIDVEYHTWEKLNLTPLLLPIGFSSENAMLAATQVVSRAVYPVSELKNLRWIKGNSAVCELTGYKSKTDHVG
nr:hypothetical protein [Mongoliibacter ruber]